MPTFTSVLLNAVGSLPAGDGFWRSNDLSGLFGASALAPLLATVPSLPFAGAQWANTKANYPANPYQYTGNPTAKYGQNVGGETYFFEPLAADWRYRTVPQEGEVNGWTANDATPLTWDAKQNVIGLADSGGTYMDALLSINVPGYYGGVWVLEWDQTVCPTMEAIFQNAFGATMALTLDDAANGRREYTLTIPASGVTEQGFRDALFSVRAHAPITGYNDWHLYMPGHEAVCKAGYPYNSVMMELFSSCQVLRCMDMLNTNGHPAANASELTDDSWGTWSERGMPIEHVFKIAAQAGVDTLWINVPHQLDTAGVTAYANRARAGYLALDPSERPARLIVEYSNEIWNPTFPQTAYAVAQGEAQFPATVGDYFGAMGAWVAHKSVEAKQVFQTAFDTDSSIIELVVCGQMSYDDVNTTRLDATHVPAITAAIDGFAFGPYYAGELDQAFADTNSIHNWTNQQFQNYCLRQGAEALAVPDPINPPFDVPGVITYFENNTQTVATYTSRNDLKFHAYETGPHFDGFGWADSANKDAQWAAMRLFNQSSEIAECNRAMIQGLLDAGIELVCAFGGFADLSDSQYWGNKQGQWGIPYPKHLAYEAISLPRATAQTLTDLKLYTFNHSLWDHSATTGQSIPYWVGRFAQQAGYQLGTNGQFGQLDIHTLPASNQNGYHTDGRGGTYDSWPSGAFEDQDYPFVLTMHSNFEQVDSAYNSAAIMTKIERVFDYVEANEPTAEKIIYEHWPEPNMVPGVPDAFALTNTEWINYWTYTAGAYHTWHVNHVAEVDAVSGYSGPVRLIPVGAVLADLFLNGAYFSGISSTVFFEDAAPHGTDDLYFLAGLVVYRAMYGVNVDSNYTIPAGVDSSIVNNFAQIIADVEAAYLAL